GTLPESGERNAREVPLQLALGSSLTAVRGYAHAEVGAAYERARVLCEALGDVTQLAAALVGLSVVHNNRAQFERGFEFAARTLADPYTLCHALFVETLIRSWRRELGSQPAAAAEAIALSDTQGFPFYLGLARAYRAAALGASGASPSAVAEVSAGMTLVE